MGPPLREISPDRILEEHTARTRYCAITPDGSVALSSSSDDTAIIWGLSADPITRVFLHGHTDTIFQCALSADGSVAATASRDGTARVWDAKSGTQQGVLVRSTDGMRHAYGCGLSTDGKLMVSTFHSTDLRKGQVVIWDVQEYRVVLSFSRSGAIFSCSLSKNAATIAFVLRKTHGIRAVEVVNRTGQLIRSIQCSAYPSFVLTPDGSQVLIADEEQLRLYKVLSNDEPIEMQEYVSGESHHCAMTSDGSLVVATAPEGSFCAWDTANGTIFAKFSGHTDVTRGCAISDHGSHCGSRMITCSDDKSVRIWSLPTTFGSITTSMAEKVLKHATAKLCTVRVLVMGARRRGKTSTIDSLLRREFVPDRPSTLGVDLSEQFLKPGSQHGFSEQSVEERKDSKPDSFSAAVSRMDPIASQSEATASDAIAAPALLDGTENLRLYQKIIKKTRKALQIRKEIHSSDGRLLRIWDFGGEKEYETSHQLFISPRCILLFAINLENLSCPNLHDQELELFFLWVEVAFQMTEKPRQQHVVVVGTRKNKCANVDETWRNFRTEIARRNKTVYDAWVQRPSISEEAKMQMIALENDGAINDPEGSGLLELEKHLWSVSGNILGDSKPVPVRWRAFIEEIESRSNLYLTKEELLDIAAGFPGFNETGDDLSAAVLDMLRCFRDLGELVLFEMSETVWIVFVNPESLLRILRAVIRPCVDAETRLPARQWLKKVEGFVDKASLRVLWDGYVPERDQDKMLDMLCSFDLLVKLKAQAQHLVGIPAVMQPLGSDVNVFSKRMGHRPNEGYIEIYTCFKNFFPRGLMGVLIANLHSALETNKTPIDNFRADAALLLLNKGARVFVRYEKQPHDFPPHIRWVIRGENSVGIARRCLRQFNTLMERQLRKIDALFEHKIVSKCEVNLSCCVEQPGNPGRGCGTEKSVRHSTCGVVHNHSSIRDYTPGALPAPSTNWRYREVPPRRYDLFVSFHGTQPLRDLGNTVALSSEHVRDLARAVATNVKSHGNTKGRLPSVFFENAHLHARLDAIFDAIMQLRGGGVALFLLTTEFFTHRFCLAELRSCLDYAENGRTGSGVQLRFVCLESDYDAILNDSLVQEHFPGLFDKYVLLDVTAGTINEMAQYISREVVWKAWTETEGDEYHAVLGGDIEASFQDLIAFFGEEYFATAKAVLLPAVTRGIESVVEVFHRARVNGAIGPNKVDRLGEVAMRGEVAGISAETRSRIESAISAYKRKWMNDRSWEWGRTERDRLKRNYESAIDGADRSLDHLFAQLFIGDRDTL